jgi:hypothetical protein
MMDPEASVSALVFHHPDAKYFNLSEQDAQRLEQEVAENTKTRSTRYPRRTSCRPNPVL